MNALKKVPYVLTPFIRSGSDGMWGEGAAYESKNIYSISAGQLPPVNYDEHILRPHSLTHMETPAHTVADGKTIEHYYQTNLSFFHGETVVLKLAGNNYEQVSEGIYHWEIEKHEIIERLECLKIKDIPPKILITSHAYPQNTDGYHNPNYILTLSKDAARFLISLPGFHLYGTSWKSSDYRPGSSERPIHNCLFEKGLVLENLHLQDVPEGIYYMVAFPLPLVGASESPVVPVLFPKCLL